MPAAPTNHPVNLDAEMQWSTPLRRDSKAAGGWSDIPSVEATAALGGANPEDNGTSSGVRSEDHVSNRAVTSVVVPANNEETNAKRDEAVRGTPAKPTHTSADLGVTISAVKSDNLGRQEEGHPSGGELALATQAEQQHNNAVVLRDGRVMAPTFRVGEVLCHDVTTTSVRITWPKPADKKYPVYGYRVCTAGVGGGFEVTYGEAPSYATESTIVGLKPGKVYQFHIASISAENMLVPGSSIVSAPTRLLEAAYERAWFFEGGAENEEQTWMAYEGLGPESISPPGRDTSTAVDDVRCSPSAELCFTGLRSLWLTVPSGLQGGAFVDTPVKQGCIYIVKARVFHEEALPIAGKNKGPEMELTTRLALWDMRDVKEVSRLATKRGEWELLECEITPPRSDRLRIAVQADGTYKEGNIYVDAVELVHGGPTPADLAMSSIICVLDRSKEPTSAAISKVKIRVESARNLKAADTMGTSDPFVKIMVGDAEVHRTKVVPMSLSPSWDETFVASLGASGGDVRFEIRDHDAHGSGDYLGEVRFTKEELVAAPPHRVDHRVVDHKASRGIHHAAPAPAGRSRGGSGRSGGGGGGGGKGGDPPSFLALAIQTYWPEDLGTAEGKLVETIQDERGQLPARVSALRELSMAALLELRNIEDATKAKEALLRARAPEAAVWVLSEPALVEDACHLLVGFLKLGRGAAGTEVGFDLYRRVQRYVLKLSPAVVVARCLRAKIGQPEILLELLAKLYIGQQAALHEDMVNIQGLFHVLVLHVDGMAPAQALMREISGGRREIPPGLVALFRRYRTRIPLLPGLWRIDVLKRLTAEELTLQDLNRNDDDDDLEGNENADQTDVGGQRESMVPWRMLADGNVAVFLLTIIPPLFMAVVGGKCVDSAGSCEQPVATLILVDGLLLLVGVLAGAGFKVGFKANPQRVNALAGKWVFPATFLVFVAHVALVAGLLAAIAQVERVGTRAEGKVFCSTGKFAWGVFFLVVHLFCLAAPPVVWCARYWDRVTKSVPALVIPTEARRDDSVAVEVNDQ